MFVNNRQNIYILAVFFILSESMKGQISDLIIYGGFALPSNFQDKLIKCRQLSSTVKIASLQKCFEIKMHLCGYARQSSPQGATQFTAKTPCLIIIAVYFMFVNYVFKIFSVYSPAFLVSGFITP